MGSVADLLERIASRHNRAARPGMPDGIQAHACQGCCANGATVYRSAAILYGVPAAGAEAIRGRAGRPRSQ